MKHKPSEKQYNYDVNDSHFQNGREDEIDFKVLFISFWEGRFIVILMSLSFFLISVAYSLLTEEKWETRAKVTEPELSQYRMLQDKVGQLSPFFVGDNVQDIRSGTLVNRLDLLFSSESLLSIYISQFNSRQNKKMFLEGDDTFQTAYQGLDLELKGLDKEKVRQAFYHSWYSKLSIIKLKKEKGGGANIFDIISTSNTAQKSYDLLSDYIAFVEHKVQIVVNENLKTLVSSKKSKLNQETLLLIEQAEGRLQLEKLKSQYELEIAKAAKVVSPIENFNDNGFFDIQLGEDAINAKLKVLAKLEDLSIFEPMLSESREKLNLLNKLKFDKPIRFQSIQFIVAPEIPHKLSAPNRKLIAILGGCFGLFVGAGVVLVGVAFRKSEAVLVRKV